MRHVWPFLCLAAACTPPRPNVVLPPARAVEQWVVEAKARLDTALRTANATRLEAELDPRATLVIRSRDSIVGAPAVVASLRAQYSGVGQPSLFMHADELDLCLDGAYEYLGSLGVTIEAADRRTTYADFRYAAKWESDGTRVRLVRLALQPPESESPAHGPLCESRSAAEFPERRVVVTFMPALLAAQPAFGREAFGRLLGGRGLVVSDVRNFIAAGYSSEPAHDAWGVLAARVRLGLGFAAEGFASLDDAIWTAQAEPRTNPLSQVSYVEFRTRPVGALVSWEYDRWRVGAGVASARLHWRWVDMAGGAAINGEANREGTTTGGVLLAAYSRPLMGRLVGEVRLQHLLGMEADVPSILGASAGRVSLGGTTLGVHLGVTFF